MAEIPKKVDLVCAGGGVKGIATLGAALTLHDAGVQFERIAGTSSGAIVATLIAAHQRAGRDLHEIEKIMREVDYSKFEDNGILGRLGGPLAEGVNVLLHDGAFSGNFLFEWLGPILQNLGVTKFSDLAIDDPDSSLHDYQSYSLVMCATDLSRQTLVRLPWDYDEYGLVGGDQLLVDAVRASISYPFVFRPVEVKTGTGGTVTWVDGGVLEDYPITVFDRTDGRPARWPTWGIQLSALPKFNDKPVHGVIGVANSTLQTLLGDRNRYKLNQEGVTQRTTFVDTSTVDTFNFQLSDQDKETLFTSGQAAARKFLDQFANHSG
jgi:NTE family protein